MTRVMIKCAKIGSAPGSAGHAHRGLTHHFDVDEGGLLPMLEHPYGPWIPPGINWSPGYSGTIPLTSAGWRAIAPASFATRYVYFLMRGCQSVYIGKAWNVLYRIEKHRRKPWWHLVDTVHLARVSGEDCASAESQVRALEHAAIAHLLPLKNLAGPPTLPAKAAL